MLKSIAFSAPTKPFRFISAMLLMLILLIIPTVPDVRAQSNSDNFYTKSYGTDDGLSSTEINAIAQTDDGYIWAAAYSGLYKFDGMQFKQVLKEEKILSVMSLYNSQDGHLWIGTNDRGLACYDTVTGEVVFYSTDDGLGSNSIHCICEDSDGTLYIGTTNSLDYIAPDGSLHSFERFADNSFIRSLCCLDCGTVVGATNAGTPFYIKDKTPVMFDDCFENGTYINCVAVKSDSHALLSTFDNRIYEARFDGRVPVVRFFGSTGDISGVCAIRRQPERELYFICADTGFGYMDPEGNFYPIRVNGFDSMICDTLEDYQGNIWFASNKYGVLKLSDNPFCTPAAYSGNGSHIVNSITKVGDYLVVGCDDGIFTYYPGTDTISKLPWQSAFEDVRIRNIFCDSRGQIWVSTYGNDGLVMVGHAGNRTVFNQQSGNAVGSRFRLVKELSDGTILAASSTGLTFIEGTETVAMLDESDGLLSPQILCLCETPGGDILAGSDGGGIYVISDRKIVDNIGVDDGLESLVILKIVPCAGGYIYITSTALYYDNGQEIRSLSNFPYSNCFDVYFSENGQAWVTSSAGIYIVDTNDMLNDQPGYPYILLNQFRGLDAKLTSNSFYHVSSDETLYLCTSDGIRSVSIPDFNALSTDSTIKAHIQSVIADEVPVLPDENGTYIIPSGTKRITVYPAVLNYSLTLPSIHLWLEGFDDTGVTYSQMEQNKVSFTNISPGAHTLYLQVLNEKDRSIINEVSVDIWRTAAFHESIWMYICISLALILTTLIFSRFHHYRIIKRQYQVIKDAKEDADRANRSKSFFLARMSHEIRTPINSILGMNEMILRESESEVIRGYAEDIDTSGKTLISLVDEILDLTKLESQKTELNEAEYSLTEMIQEVFSTLQLRGEAKGLRIIGDIDENLPELLIGDSLRIKEVLLNLISNAVKYTIKGSITLMIVLTEDNPDNVRIRFSVKDTGIGIAEKDQEKIFDAFERLDNNRLSGIDGTGLGLNICKRILELMDSELRLDSTVGTGSEFSFSVYQKKAPAENSEHLKAPQINHAAEEKEHGRYINPDARILVVDDTPLNLKVVKTLLKNTQATIDTAACGKDCIRLADKYRYDLILLDDMMPEMSGRETLEWLRSNPNLSQASPIAVLTANAIVGAREEYLKAGFDAYLPKPVTMADLENVLTLFIGGNKNADRP